MRKLIVWLQLCLQLLLPILASDVYATGSPFSTDRAADSNSSPAANVDSPINTGFQSRSGGDAGGMAANMASAAVSDGAEQWLRQFGTAQINLRTNEHFTLEGSSLDLLVPLFDTPRDIFFTQGGVRYNDDRVTTNLGLGHRHFINSWMLGYNAFYDSTWNNVNRRWGLGLEAWRDNLHLSSNLYQGITGWHGSLQHEGYDERPADGWDIRAEGWLPALPQVGMKAVYEQYYGKNVALFSNFSDRQNNPHAFTLGLNYTPVSLVTMGVEQKIGKGGVNDSQLTLGLNYRFGEPWGQQMSPAAVASMREISSSRLDLVNRNNDIVLDYRKQNELQLSFPAHISGEEGATVTFAPVVKASNGLDHIELNDTALLQAGGVVLSVGNNAISIRLPAYQSQPVSLSGVAVDEKGNRSNTAVTLITTTQKEEILVLTTDKTQANANGKDVIVTTLHLTDRNGGVMNNQAVSWHNNSGGQLSAVDGKTDSHGNASVSLSSAVVGNFTVSASVGSRTATTEELHFINISTATTQIAADKTTALANGTDAVTYTVVVKNGSGQPVAGEAVTWGTDLGTPGATGGTTDANGQLQMRLTSTDAGQATVTAKVAGQTLTAPVVTFSEILTPAISVDKTTALANGTDSVIYTVIMRNGSGQPVAGEAVVWGTDLGTPGATGGTTDANGQLQMRLTSTDAGQATVTAKVAGQTLTAPVVTFSEILAPAISVDKTTALANGTDAAIYTVVVKNGKGQSVAGEAVTWGTDLGTPGATGGTTDANGQLQMRLTSTDAGQATVTAKVAGQTLTAPVVTFNALLGAISLDVPTTIGPNGAVINQLVSLTAKFTTSYSGMQAGDVITLSFTAQALDGGDHSFTSSHTVTMAEVTTGSVAMGPYPSQLSGIDTGAGVPIPNAAFTSTVNRPSTGESQSVTVSVLVDTVGAG
jgi:hypothetical protein